MKAVITADIIQSSKMPAGVWMEALKSVLKKFGKQGKSWEIYRGDEIQLLLDHPEEAFLAAVTIKAEIRKSDFDARISIGLGEMDYSGTSIKESNGSAFVNSGRNLELLKSSKNQSLSIKSDDEDFDENFNLIFKLLENLFEKWKTSTATSVSSYLEHKNLSQTQIAEKMGITQGALSRALKRGGLDSILETDDYFRKKVKKQA